MKTKFNPFTGELDYYENDHANLTGVTATQHHTNANDPSAGEKQALAGTSGAPGVANPYVTEDDSRMDDARVPTNHGNAQHTSTFITEDANARVAVKKAGAGVGIRRGINLIEGTNITLTVADDAVNEDVDITIAAAGGGSKVFAFFAG